jgi:phosphoribosylaminoimidazole carboxylase PurE protein
VKSARERGLRLIIAGAGSSAHLAGVTAAETTLPVIGVPIDSSPLSGFDALLSTVQMPPGVPVGTMGVGKSGATNAGFLPSRYLLADDKLATKLAEYKIQLEKTVADKQKVQELEAHCRVKGHSSLPILCRAPSRRVRQSISSCWTRTPLNPHPVTMPTLSSSIPAQ